GSHDQRTARAGSRAGPRHTLRQRDADVVGVWRSHWKPALFRGVAGDRRARLRGYRRPGQVPHARRDHRMTSAADLPLWAAILVAAFLLLGAGLTLTGCIGFIRLRSFYDRIHAPTLGTSWGTASIVIASMITFTVLEGRPVFAQILVGIFL